MKTSNDTNTLTLSLAIRAFLENNTRVQFRDRQGEWVPLTLGTTMGELYNTQFRLEE